MGSRIKLAPQRSENLDSMETIFPSADNYYSTYGKKISTSKKIFKKGFKNHEPEDEGKCSSTVRPITSSSTPSSTTSSSTPSSTSSSSTPSSTTSSSTPSSTSTSTNSKNSSSSKAKKSPESSSSTESDTSLSRTSSSDSCGFTNERSKVSPSSSEDSEEFGKFTTLSRGTTTLEIPEATNFPQAMRNSSNSQSLDATKFSEAPRLIKLIGAPPEIKKSGIIIVDPIGGNDGSPNPAYKTLEAAIQKATGYETIQLYPGQYTNIPFKTGLIYQGIGKVFVDGWITGQVKSSIYTKFSGITFRFQSSVQVSSPMNFENCTFETRTSNVMGGITEMITGANSEFNGCRFKISYTLPRAGITAIRVISGNLTILNSDFTIQNGPSSSVNVIYLEGNSNLIMTGNRLYLIDKNSSKYTWIAGNQGASRKILAYGNMIAGINEGTSHSIFVPSDLLPLEGNHIKLLPENSWRHIEFIVYKPSLSRARIVTGNDQVQNADHRIFIESQNPIVLTLPIISQTGNDMGQEIEIINLNPQISHKIIPSLGNNFYNGGVTIGHNVKSMKFQPIDGKWYYW